MPKIDAKILLLFFGRLFQSAFAVITIKVMTELLPQSEVGNQYLIQSLLLGFVLILINPVGMFVNRHFHEWKADGHLYYAIKELNLYFGLVAVLSVPVTFIVRYFSDFGVGLHTFAVVAFILFYIYLSTWFQTLVSFFNLMEFQKIFVALNVVSQGVGIFSAFIFIKVFGATAIPWLSGLLCGQVISLATASFLFRRFVSAAESKPLASSLIYLKTTFFFCLPVAGTTLFMWFINQGYRLFIESDVGVDSLASLGLGLGLAASFCGAIESIATQYFYPGYYASLRNSSVDQRRVAWADLWTSLLRVYIPTFFLAISSSYFLVRFLTSEKFYHVYYFVFFGAAVELFRQMANVVYLVSHGEKKTKFTIGPYMSGAVALISALLLLRLKGELTIFHVAICLILANLIALGYGLFIAKKLIGYQPDVGFLLKCFVVSVPVLLPVFFINVKSSVLALLMAEVVAGALWAGVIYILFARKT